MVKRIDHDIMKTFTEKLEILKNNETKDPILNKVNGKNQEKTKESGHSGYSRMHHRHNRS